MMASLERLTNQKVFKLDSHKPDAFLESIVLTWPPRFNTIRALELGFRSDLSAEEIIRLYIEEEGINKT